jgi:hypothetical protein
MSQYFGTSNLDTAKKCFIENRDRFSDPTASPEKYNLYNGLANLAVAMEKLEAEIKELKQIAHHQASKP